jgi:predicted nucleic acid-binding Zn ribbon protein
VSGPCSPAGRQRPRIGAAGARIGAVPWQPLPSASDRDPVPLVESLERLVGGWGAASTGTTRSLFAEWDDIVGPRLAAQARPRSLRQGTLVVAVSDPAWATQLRFLEADLVARIQATTGTSEVRSIQVRVVPPGS